MKKTIITTLVLVTALFTLGTKWAEKPIDSLASIAGTWSGTGGHPRGARYTVTYWFKEDGSFKFSAMREGPGGLGVDAMEGKGGPGALWVEAGKLRYKSPMGPWTYALYTSKKGKQMLRGERPDGNKQELKRAQ